MCSEAAAALQPRRAPGPRGGLFGNLGWPILLKEIRGDFRKGRFFVSHLVCLGAMAAGVLWSVVAQTDKAEVRPEVVGRGIFNTFFLIQYLVVLVVFPAFSSHALSEERSSRTLDLLITTDLRPEEVIWGKFLGSSIYCLIYIVATVPLLAISLLFAGVSLSEVLQAYLILIGLTVLLSIAGVFISGWSSSSLRSTLLLYTLSFVVLGISLYRGRGLLQGDSTLMRSLWNALFPGSAHWSEVLEGTLGALAVGILVFAYLFLLAANAVRPASTDRTSRLRVLTVLAVLGLLAWRLAALRSVSSGSERQKSFEGLLLASLVALLTVGVLFSAETAPAGGRLRRQAARFRGLFLPLRLFAPGPFWGLLYAVGLSALAGGLLAGAWFGFLSGGEADRRFAECLLTLPIYVLAFSALAFLLSTLDFSPLYTVFTVASVFTITLLLPVILWIGGRGDGLLSLYYLSPVTLWQSLGSHEADGPRFVLYGIPILRVAQVLFSALAVLFTVLGLKQAWRKGYPPARPRPVLAR